MFRGPARSYLWVAALFATISTATATRTLFANAPAPKVAQCRVISDVLFDGATIYAKKNVATPAACCKACSDNIQCQRWSYYPKARSCLLKHPNGWTRKTSPGTFSGQVMRNATYHGASYIRSPPPPASKPIESTNPVLAPLPAPGMNFTSKNYADVLGLSWMFYEAQRSGVLPQNHRISWRASSHTKDLVPGGWYDSGDYLKMSFPLAGVVSTLSWGLMEFKEGYFEATERDNALENLSVAVDYLLRCHIAPRKYVGIIGNPGIDHDYWGRAERQTTARPTYVYDDSMGASDLLGKVAAALASSAIVWREFNATYSADLLEHAKDIYQWGTEREGLYSNYYKESTDAIYPSSHYADDMAYGAYWMYRATKTRKYLEESVAYWKQSTWDVLPDWDNSGPFVAVGLANLVEDGESVPSGADIKDWVVNTFLKDWSQRKGDIVETSKGLRYPSWSEGGDLQLSTTASFLALLHAKHTKTDAVKNEAIAFAKSQIDFALGTGERSYVVGYGKDPPLRATHAGASCPNSPTNCDWTNFETDKPNPQILYGALVGGPPGGNGTYVDSRKDASNEVTLEQNAGFTSALAGLLYLL